MTAIFLIVFLALFGLIVKGDNSLLLAIFKFIGYAAIIFIVLCMIGYTPWLCVLIIIGIVIFIICQSNNKNSNIDNIHNNQVNTIPEYEQQEINNPTLTGFKAELQANTKTPNQVEDEEWCNNKIEIIKRASNDYLYIKNELMDKAKSGKYNIVNGKRIIIIQRECGYIMKFISRNYSELPTGKIYTSSYRSNAKTVYAVNRIKEYNLYCEELKRLATIDDIDANLIFIDNSLNVKTVVNLPYIDKSLLCRTNKIQAYWKCTIEY